MRRKKVMLIFSSIAPLQELAGTGTNSNLGISGGKEDIGFRSVRQSAAGEWQRILKLVDSRSKVPHRYGAAYEVVTVQGEKVFFGVISSNARTSIRALLEAMLKAVLTAKEQGFQLVLVLSNSRSLLQTYKRKSALDWLDSTRLADLCFLNQNGFFCDVFWVPSVVVNSLKSVARLVTRVLIHHCWFSSVG
ncbi:uncharacterized protein LOC142631096 [Castanea sativa]|uniref:uncharacterized protein LOC142631096 n=1 Tax=Castanea sativa TaxID=21020 RepID=UPI003F6492AF